MKERMKRYFIPFLLFIALIFVINRYVIPHPVSVLNGWGNRVPDAVSIGRAEFHGNRYTDIDDPETLAPLIGLLQQAGVVYRFKTDRVPARYSLSFRSFSPDASVIYDSIRVAGDGYLYLEDRAYALAPRDQEAILTLLDRLTDQASATA